MTTFVLRFGWLELPEGFGSPQLTPGTLGAPQRPWRRNKNPKRILIPPSHLPGEQRDLQPAENVWTSLPGPPCRAPAGSLEQEITIKMKFARRDFAQLGISFLCLKFKVLFEFHPRNSNRNEEIHVREVARLKLVLLGELLHQTKRNRNWIFIFLGETGWKLFSKPAKIVSLEL